LKRSGIIVDIPLVVTDFNVALCIEKESFCMQAGLLHYVSDNKEC